MTNIFHNRSAKYINAKSFLTRSSRYVGALASFVEDTKPYHSKLTDVVEEYQFYDSMAVKLTEATKTFTHISSTWTYNYFSSGIGSSLTIPAKALHTPFSKGFPLNSDPITKAPNIGSIKVGRDEITELSTMPYVYSKQTFDGIADVFVERASDRTRLDPLYEGLDYYHSKGAFQFQITQTTDANGQFVPTWVDLRKKGVVTHAAQEARLHGNDLTNPNSAISKVKALLLAIQPSLRTAAATALFNDLMVSINAAPTAADFSTFSTILSLDGLVPPVITGYNLIKWARDREAQLPPASLAAYKDLFGDHPGYTGGLDHIDKYGASYLPWSNISSEVDEHGVPVPFFRSNYEPLLNQLIIDGTAPPTGFTCWIGNDGESQTTYNPLAEEWGTLLDPLAKCVSEAFSSFSPPLYFNSFGETDVHETGKPEYDNVLNAYVRVSDVVANSNASPADAWRLVANNSIAPYFDVFSELTGYIGTVVATVGGTHFTSTNIAFVVTHLAQSPVGETLHIRNRNRIVFSPTTPLETWTVVKTSPTSYTRPSFTSTRNGYLENPAILDQELNTGFVILSARADGVTFDVTHDAMPSYVDVAHVDVPFSNHIAFTIRAGLGYTFVAGDRFFIHVNNEPASISNLEIDFGYDLDSYDNQDALYGGTTESINFAYATRFIDYDFNLFNLRLTQNTPTGRTWRLTAIPDRTRPVNPDIPIGGAPIPTELQVYYASFFNVSYSDNNFITSTSVGVVPVDTPYTNVPLGISFTIASGARPFIGVVTNDVPALEGGDVISFDISNPGAVLDQLPAGLSSSNIARLMPYAAGFYEAPAANWSVTFTSATEYVVQGALTSTPGIVGPSYGSLLTLGVGPNEGYTFKDLDIHFTLIAGRGGFSAGDRFTFTTYERKPTYLVYGSASGWQGDAAVGETYWNGKIGFTIKPPTATLHSLSLITPADPTEPVYRTRLIDAVATNEWLVDPLKPGRIKLKRLRFDAPNRIYTLYPLIQAHVNIGWMVHADDVGVVGRLLLAGSFSDEHTTIEASGFAAGDVITMRLVIEADDFDSWAGQDVIILRSDVQSRLPVPGDCLLVDGRLTELIGINLNYEASVSIPSITELAPISIDPRYIDVSTGLSQISLNTTSPEARLLSTWVPLSMTSRDSATSVAAFPDEQIAIDIRSLGTDKLIGTLAGTAFTWDQDFISTYMPLDSEANVVIYNTGATERVRANITETFNVFISAGVTSIDYLLHDTALVRMPDATDWVINITQPELTTAVVSDAQTGKFLAGFDNLPYGFEPGLGDINTTTVLDDGAFYDLGIPLTGTFMLAKELSVLAPADLALIDPSTTLPKTVVLRQALAMLTNFLVNGDIAQTELIDFLRLIDEHIRGVKQLDVNGNWDGVSYIKAPHSQELTSSYTGFGYPESGVAFASAVQNLVPDPAAPSGTRAVATASFQDAVTFVATNTTTGLATAILHSNTVPINQTVPNPIPPLTDYESFQTPLTVFTPAKRIQISFLMTDSNHAAVEAMARPHIFVWLPGDAQPHEVTYTRVEADLDHAPIPSGPPVLNYPNNTADVPANPAIPTPELKNRGRYWFYQIDLAVASKAKIYMTPG